MIGGKETESERGTTPNITRIYPRTSLAHVQAVVRTGDEEVMNYEPPMLMLGGQIWFFEKLPLKSLLLELLKDGLNVCWT